MTTNEQGSTCGKVAVVRAVAVEISCPLCPDDQDPIPAPDGSFMWDHVPAVVGCPRCRKRFRMPKKIALES